MKLFLFSFLFDKVFLKYVTKFSKICALQELFSYLEQSSKHLTVYTHAEPTCCYKIVFGAKSSSVEFVFYKSFSTKVAISCGSLHDLFL